VDTAFFDSRGDRVVTAGSDRTAMTWTSSGTHLVTMEGHTGAVLSAVFDPEGDLVITASQDGTARVWDPITGTTLDVLDHDATVNFATFSHDGYTVATVGDDGLLKLWSIQYDSHPLKELDNIVKCKVSLRIEGERIVPTEGCEK
jgi:WD40 repeat protein